MLLEKPSSHWSSVFGPDGIPKWCLFPSYEDRLNNSTLRCNLCQTPIIDTKKIEIFRLMFLDSKGKNNHWFRQVLHTDNPFILFNLSELTLSTIKVSSPLYYCFYEKKSNVSSRETWCLYSRSVLRNRVYKSKDDCQSQSPPDYSTVACTSHSEIEFSRSRLICPFNVVRCRSRPYT